MCEAAARERLAALRAQLAQADQDYRLLGGDGVGWSEFEFIGTFAGVETLWQAQLTALGREAGGPQSIEIDPSPDGVTRRLRIALAIERVDAAAIRKAIIMIRNYKRLRVGRHEWRP